MVPIPRFWAMLIALVVSLVVIPIAFLQDGQDMPGFGVLPLVLGVEVVLYFVLALFASTKMQLGTALYVALSFVIIRALCSAGAGFVFSLTASGDGSSILAAWVGNFVSVALQMLMLVFLGTHIVAAKLPEVLTPELASMLSGDDVPAPARASARGGDARGAKSSSARDGFVQVFSYDELAGTLRKTQGLEGFVVFSNEGLVVWRDLPMRLDLDRLVAQTLATTDQMGAVMDSAGLTRVRRVMAESKEHFLFTTSLNSSFGLLLLFNSRVAPEEILSRVGYLSKTAREFLQWKYPALPLTASMSSDRIAVGSLN